MSIFSNPNQTSTGTSFAPRLQTPGQYNNCQCIKFQKLPEGGKAVAVIEWKVPNSPATIQDFITDPQSQSAVDYIIGHAKELFNAISDKQIGDEEKDLDWAEKVFAKAAEQHVTTDIIITLRNNPNGNDYTNTRYIKKNASAVTETSLDDIEF